MVFWIDLPYILPKDGLRKSVILLVGVCGCVRHFDHPLCFRICGAVYVIGCRTKKIRPGNIFYAENTHVPF